MKLQFYFSQSVNTDDINRPRIRRGNAPPEVAWNPLADSFCEGSPQNIGC
ncbi:hypothetical protein [Marinomonas sp. 2405UD68-3]